MLVVTRKLGQDILIGDDIIVRVAKVEDGNVRIGIEAPKDVKVYRREIYEKIPKEN